MPPRRVSRFVSARRFGLAGATPSFTEVEILVVAKDPVPGEVKTRLCPPCSPEQAARIARAALEDTLDVATATGLPVVLALAGDPRRWTGRRGIEIEPQHGSTFADRLAHAWASRSGGCVQIGMDTPQVSAELLLHAVDAVTSAGAALGMAADGGWWALGLRRAQRTVFRGIPMSTEHTGRLQRDRLCEVGCSPVLLPTMVDIDTWYDALAVAATVPGSRTAAEVGLVEAVVGCPT
jgi:glycosyltransferase A (GT-A) superfamily protein (DUF2064 family)